MKTKSQIPSLVAALAAGLFLAPSIGSAQSILRTAGDFTLFGGTAITSTGPTIIRNGNVGLSPGATTGITGFPPGVIVNGAIIGTGPATAQARLDLMKAQVGLAGMPSNANLSTVDLGGLTLAPGVYTFNSAASLIGNLVLDGQGKNNVFWVFQIGTTLTTAINSTVTIINPGSNGGSDYGIFWNCGAAVNIGADNDIAGNYLAGTSLNFGINSDKGGRALALAAVTLDTNQIDAKGGPGGSDYSGGLIYDRNGNVVPFGDGNVFPFDGLSVRYFPKRNRVTQKAFRIVRGTASVNATSVEWQTNNRKHWKSVSINADGVWKVRSRNYNIGRNRLRLRAVDADGAVSPVKTMWIRRH